MADLLAEVRDMDDFLLLPLIWSRRSLLMSNIKYSNQIYEVKYTRYPKNRRYKVQLIHRPEYHTHVRSLKEAIDLANYAKHKHIPDNAKADYLYSLYRILTDIQLKSKVQAKIEVQLQKRGKSYVEGCNDGYLFDCGSSIPARIHR